MLMIVTVIFVVQHMHAHKRSITTQKNLYLILRSYYDYVFHFTCSGGDDDDADDNTRPASSGCVLFVRMWFRCCSNGPGGPPRQKTNKLKK